MQRKRTYDMNRVLHVPVRPELALDVLVTEDARLDVEMLAVRAKEAAVEGDGREKSEGGLA